ncbi:hypothetical protein [Nocardioides sp. MH1]|uniref:hypothetical protein n=1 Tax=Nocardioides sp. MH1 TaxID=3242490 RepID=UPI0035220B2F
MTTRPSIYEHLRGRLDEVGRLEDPSLVLPDERAATDDEVRWAPGAMDGVLGHHAGAGDGDQQAQVVVTALLKACRRPTRSRLRAVHAAVTADNALSYLDAAIERLADARPDPAALHEVGRWLATTAADRSAVKVGIALLGITGLGQDVDVVRVLGAHDEFTLYAAVAMTNGLEHPDSELWALAAAVDGWGRIHCVERLRGTTDPAIRSWVLRTGFRNSVMYEYLAYIAATTGGLLEALSVPEPDRDLLTAAGEIMEALVMGGPAEDMHDYADGADAVAAYLGHLSRRAETLVDFHAVVAIRDFLASDADWDDLGARGWTASRREAFEQRCAEILGRQHWRERVILALASDRPGEFWRADQAARALGIDTYRTHLERVRADPLGSDWFAAWQQADPTRAVELAALARDLLPLGEIATGPGTALGLGPEWRAHSALDWSLQALGDHPGVGAELITTGLRSPVVRNRNMALTALGKWPRDTWPEDARRLVADLARTDPQPRTRELAAELVTSE